MNRREDWAAMSWIIGYGYMYLGFAALHLLATYYIFTVRGFWTAFLAFFFPGLSALAAIVVTMSNGKYSFLLITLAYIFTPVILVLSLALVEKVKNAARSDTGT